MKKSLHQRGQALILITLAIVGLIAMTALAVDGGLSYADRRNAQNASDSAALAGALAYARGNNISTAAQSRAFSNGYTNNGTDVVTVTAVSSPSGVCPGNPTGKDITVEITSHKDTFFGPVVGINQVTNTVTATARACDSTNKALFNGNAIVALAPTGNVYDAHGTPIWNITGGGIFANSSSSFAATCGGNAGVNSPSVTAVGGTSFTCHTVNIGTVTTGVHQYTVPEYQSMLPRIPACDGTATQSGGHWSTQSGTDGSRVAFSGDMVFNPGLYCITNSPGPFHGAISGDGVTFYIMSSSFSMKFNGGGNLTATAPTGAGEYKGVLMFSAPQLSGNSLQHTQSLDMRGNGNADIVGSIIMPSADVTMFGNSGTAGFHCQVIAYNVDTGGNANITINYQADENYQPPTGITLQLLR
jgi:Flp pilus assembly protein TadG